MKNLLKFSATAWSSVIVFSETICSWPSWVTFFFFDECYFRFCFYFICKKWLYRLPKDFVLCDVARINITKEVLIFTPNQTYTEITLLLIFGFVFYRILSLLLTSFYENLTTRFLLSQNFESFLACLLLLDQCKKVLTDI